MNRLETLAKIPLVSVIIPAYNAEPFIRKTIDSVLAQTYDQFEIIVVDDGSSDRTAEIVREIAQQDDRITLFQQKNAGVAAARNLAISHAQGDYIAPIDADDIWYPRKLEKQMQVMLNAGPEVGLVYAWSVYITEAGDLTTTCQINYLEGAAHIPMLYGNQLGNASSALIRRVCFEAVGGYNSQLRAHGAQGCEDWDLYLRIAEKFEFRVVPELLVGYRQVLNSMSFNHLTMKRSSDFVLASARTRFPKIPEVVYQWSNSSFNWYLAMRCDQCDDYSNTIHYLYRSAQTDFFPLLRPRFYKLLSRSLFNLLLEKLGIFSRQARSTESSELEVDQRDQSNQSIPISLDELSQSQLRDHQTFPRKQYNAFLAYRWRKIQNQLNHDLNVSYQSNQPVVSASERHTNLM